MLLYFSCIFRSDSSSSLSSDSYLSLTRLKRSANKMGPLVLQRQRLQKTLLPTSVLLQSKSPSLSKVKESLLSLKGLSSFTVKENDTTYLILFSAALSHSSLASDVSSSSLVITISISCMRINTLHCKMNFNINQRQSWNRSNLVQQRLAICHYVFCHLSLYCQGRVLYKKLTLLETDESLHG